MNVCVFIILLVIQAMTSEKAVSKLRSKLIVPKMNEKCKKIKCATVDEPQCVRMRRHDLKIHIIAANKCELDYLKCHDDVEAKIVPMKYCSHNIDHTDGEKKNKRGKAYIRVKRRLKAVVKPIQREAESNKKEYEEICSTVCPSRDVMVCGKCQHGIYKTFISVCHLRMFTCNHQDEILQLVSRYPCVLSAPYIPDSSTKPKGRILEPSDDDKILRFIMCRDQGKLGTDEKPAGDARCNFRPTKDKLKYFDFKGVYMHLDPHLMQNESSEY